MLISRRDFIKASASLGFLSLFSSPAHSFMRSFIRKPEKSLWFYNTHTGETLKEMYWQDGKYLPSSLKQFYHILRDHRCNSIKALRLDLFDLLHDLQQLLGYRKPFDIISGYRSPLTNARLRGAGRKGVAKNSYHMKGMAIDVHFRGFSLLRARKAACFLGRGGVGYYPSSGFIHMDVRGKKTQWQGA